MGFTKTGTGKIVSRLEVDKKGTIVKEATIAPKDKKAKRSDK